MFKKNFWTVSIPMLIAPVALVTGLSVAATANAAELLTAQEITEAVSNHTFQGSMTVDRFAEYYAADGTIKAEGYSGKWHVNDGEMCFQYGTDPETCWEIKLNGAAVTLFKGGKVDGNGMLIEGNVYNFK